MLIWIKAPCVAIGVLASFVLLLSTVVSENVDLNVTSEVTSEANSAVTSEATSALEYMTTPLSENTDFESLQLMSLPFASSLSNPCSWESEYSRSSYVSLEGHRVRFIEEFFRIVTHYAKFYKEEARGMLQNHTIAGCSSLHVNNLPHTPTLGELEELNMDEALNKIYLSLLVHAAYSHFVHHQFVTSDLRCSGDIEEEQSLANQSLSIAFKQKALACYIRVGMTALGYGQGDVLPLLNDTISDLSQCSRRALRDCQVMKSTYNFLGIVSDYASDEVSESSSVLPSTIGDKR